MDKLKLYNNQGQFQFKVDLAQEIDRGGEGMILPHPKIKNQVLKIYHDGITPGLTQLSWKYLAQLSDNFIKPLELFYDDKGELRGFSMEHIENSYLRLSQLFSKAQCARLRINFNIKTDLVNELIGLIKEAHDKNIVIGDFNPFNIFVNALGSVKIIDTDSFETPVQKHSGRLLDEIRDHYYLGAVNRESDYYALAVNVFRLLTYVHPYKGIHKTWKQLEERAIKKLSVLSNNIDLIIPAFYEPLADTELKTQFERIFESGERFLINLNHQNSFKPLKITLNKPITSGLNVKVIAERVIDFYFNNNLGYIKTEENTEIFECNYPGKLISIDTFKNNRYDFLWLGNHNYLRIKNNVIFHRENRIQNLEIPENFRFVQMEHLIFGVDWENIYHISPDKIVNGNLLWSKKPAWGRGFKFNNAPLQLTGGIFRLHSRNGVSINTIRLLVNAKQILVQQNICVISYFEQEKLKHFWGITEGLNIIIVQETEEILSFAVNKLKMQHLYLYQKMAD